MTIQTLEYIYKLLLENEAKYLTAKRTLREALDHAEENEAENVEALTAAYDRTRQSYSEAYDARVAFESKEW